MGRAFRIPALLLFLAGCSNSGSDLGFAPVATRTVAINVFVDRDASGSSTPADTVYSGARVSIRPLPGGEPLLTGTTNAQGLALLFPVPVGEYRVTVDGATVGDTLSVGGIQPDPLILVAAPDTGTVGVSVRLGYPSVSIRQARQEPLGRRLLIQGLVLAGVQSFRDTTSHVQDTSGYVRLTRVSLRGGSTGNNPGDTVTVIGTTSSRAGQPTLDQAIITFIGTRPAPVPRFITTSVAAAAMGGSLDAGLVQIDNALITDTLTVTPDFRVVANDGSGAVTVLLDAQGGFNRSSFVPGRRMTARGVLVPTGAGQWQLKPRSPGDVSLF